MTPSRTYRVPARPGYLGQYQWRTVLLGLLALPVVSFLVTQSIADHFQYHPDLGEPLIRVGLAAIYQPFAWLWWIYQFAGSSDPAVSRPVLYYGAGAIAASTAVVVICGLTNMRRTRNLSNNLEDLHGSARWADAADIRSRGLLGVYSGVYVGGWFNERDQHLHYLRHDGPEHILAFAPSRSGKGVGLVIPTLLAWEESAVIYDIKGENWAKTAGFRATAGHLCFKFSPVEDGNSSRFNPLAELRLHTPRDVSDAQNVADIIIRSGEHTPQEPYWPDAAASITTGMILHVCYAARAQNRTACLADLAAVFNNPEASFRITLQSLINYEHDPGGAHGWRMASSQATTTHPVVRLKVREMLNKEQKDFSGVLSTATTALALFTDPLVAANTAASDFRIDDLVNHETPVSLYIVVPPSDKIRLRPLVRLIFTIIVNRLTEKLDFDGSAQKKNAHRLLFLIDEFPSLKRMALFADALSYMGGFGLKAYLIAQDICQITEEYGTNQSIVSNCDIQIAYAPNNLQTAEHLSKRTGVRTIEKANVHYSGQRSSPVMGNVSTSLELIQRPLLTPDEVQRIRAATKVGNGAEERIAAPGDMLIFHGGHYPIYGRQMCYFFDPELTRRAGIAPPTVMIRIGPDGKVGEQLPQHKTENLISPPELLPHVYPVAGVVKLPDGTLQEVRMEDWPEDERDEPRQDQPQPAKEDYWIP